MIIRTQRQRLSRRHVLRGAAGACLALPLLDAMLDHRAEAQTNAPRRLVFEFKPNGDQISERFTNTDETDFQFGEFLAPLESYRDELLVLHRLDRRIFELPTEERSDNHQMGTAGLAPWSAGPGNFPVGGEDRTIGPVIGPSADVEIGRRVIAEAPGVQQEGLILRVGGRNNDNTNILAHGGPVGQQNQLSPETDPDALYARLFSMDSGAEAKHRALLKQSMLDVVKEENDALLKQLGREDQQKLERYTEALRNIERSLYAAERTASCQPQAPALDFNVYNDTYHAEVGKAFHQLIALCFSCDLTRVVNFAWHGGVSNRLYRDLGMSEGHHDISHQSTDEAFERIRAIQLHLWTQSVNLFEVLKSTPEGDGSLWDNTLVVHWNELGQGDSHTIEDLLVVFAGGMGGHFQRGRYVDLGNRASFSDMLLNCFHYMGYDDVTEFGDPRLTHLNGPIGGLGV